MMAFDHAQPRPPRRERPANRQPLDRPVPHRSPSADLDRAAAGLDADLDVLLLDCGLLRGWAERIAGRGAAQPLALHLIHDKGGVS
jgi:hypothetical protein